MRINFQGQGLQLHAHKAIYWEEAQSLLIADLHLGKVAHFRKNGLAAPASAAQVNYERLADLIQQFSPQRVLFLGDLFHSRLNYSWEQFCRFLLDFPSISFELIKGNHDILPEAIYQSSALAIHPETLTIPPFILSHYPLEEVPAGLYNFYGHLHPGVVLEGLGKQRLKLPCFHFGAQQGVLPAFGVFTGLSLVRPQADDRVFVVAENEVLEVS